MLQQTWNLTFYKKTHQRFGHWESDLIQSRMSHLFLVSEPRHCCAKAHQTAVLLPPWLGRLMGGKAGACSGFVSWGLQPMDPCSAMTLVTVQCEKAREQKVRSSWSSSSAQNRKLQNAKRPKDQNTMASYCTKLWWPQPDSIRHSFFPDLCIATVGQRN